MKRFFLLAVILNVLFTNTLSAQTPLDSATWHKKASEIKTTYLEIFDTFLKDGIGHHYQLVDRSADLRFGIISFESTKYKATWKNLVITEENGRNIIEINEESKGGYYSIVLINESGYLHIYGSNRTRVSCITFYDKQTFLATCKKAEVASWYLKDLIEEEGIKHY